MDPPGLVFEQKDTRLVDAAAVEELVAAVVLAAESRLLFDEAEVEAVGTLVVEVILIAAGMRE